MLLLDLTKLAVRPHPFATATKEEATGSKSSRDEDNRAASFANIDSSTLESNKRDLNAQSPTQW